MNSIICVNSVISGEIGDNGTEIISVKLLTASVNPQVVGSSPTGGAKKNEAFASFFFVSTYCIGVFSVL